MANITENKTIKTNTTREPSAKDKEIARLKDELAKANSERDSMRSDMDALKAQMDMLLQMATGKSVAQKEEAVEEPDVEIGYHGFTDMIVESTDSTVSLRFSPAEIKTIPYEDMKTILKENQFRKNKKLFEKDILYFVNEEDYARFKIRKNIDFSDEEIKEILFTPNKDDMLRKFKAFTNNGKDRTIVFIFQYRVVEMLLSPKKPLRNWDYENRLALEDYMGVKFDRLIEYSGIFKMLGNR